MEDDDVRYEDHLVYTKGIGYAPEHMTVPSVKLDRIPEGGSSHPTQGFKFVHTILDAQGKPVGWGMVCITEGCTNLCKTYLNSDGTVRRFEAKCTAHGGDCYGGK